MAVTWFDEGSFYFIQNMPNSSELTKSNSVELQLLVDSYWQWKIKDLPEFATSIGIHKYDHLLDDLSLSAVSARYNQCRIFLAQAKELQKCLNSQDDLINYRSLMDDLTTFCDGYQYKGHYFPVSYIDAFHNNFCQLVNWMKKETVEDLEKIISRYDCVSKQIDEIIVLMKAGVSEGITFHKVSMIGVVEGLRNFIVENPSESRLYQYFTSLPDSISKQDGLQLQIKVQTIISLKIMPAIGNLQNFISSEYVTRPDISISTLPQGNDMYKQILKFHTSTSLSAEEIHNMGLEEVKRIQNEMEKIIKELGHNMTLSEFSMMVKEDANFYFKNHQEIIDKYKDICLNKVPSKLSTIFYNKDIPTLPLRVEADHHFGAAMGFYHGSSVDSSRPGVFYVNVTHPHAQPKYSMLTLALHEANPGHHLQISNAIQFGNVPAFRIFQDSNRNYGTPPSRFPINSAYKEGWGLYSESLGEEMGLYGDPYDRFGHLSEEIFRACRLVVDTGIHALGWTRQQAVDYLFNNSASSIKHCENEVNRYITMPGQAVAYKVGELKIQELRHRATEKLGEKFNIKMFHHIVLKSVGPLSILEEQINAWIASGKI